MATDPNYVKTFNIAKYRYGNVYMYSNVVHDVIEDDVRFGIIDAHTDFLVATNARYLTSELGVNESPDLTQEVCADLYAEFHPASLWSDRSRASAHEYKGAPLAPSGVSVSRSTSLQTPTLGCGLVCLVWALTRTTKLFLLHLLSA